MGSVVTDVRPPSGENPGLTSSESNMHAARLTDAQYLSTLSEKYLVELNNQSRLEPTLTPVRQLLRIVHRAKQWVARICKEIIQDNWDIGLFNVIFGSIKMFGVYLPLIRFYPQVALVIPILEFGPLNTELWTVGHLFCRRHILSRLGQLRYGRSLNEMNAYRDETLRIQPRDARSIHRLEYESIERTVRIRRNRLLDWMRRLRRNEREPNVVLQSELRRMVSDKEFLFQANELRNNAYLYEEIMIKKVLSSPDDRPKLLERLVPELPLTAERDRKLLAAIGETLIPAYALVIEQGNSLTATLRMNLGHQFSATSLSLRWINWSYQRMIYQKLAELDVLHYRLLAHILSGNPIEASEHLVHVGQIEKEIQIWAERAKGFGDKAKAVTSKTEAHRLILSGIQEAQSVGLRSRLARTAFWLSPSPKQVS